MDTFKLRKPLLVNGKELTELTYDFEEIDGALWDEAVRRAGKRDNFNISLYDYIFHKCLAFAAVIAVNPSIDWDDLDRLKGLDLQRLANIGLTFMTDSSEELSLETSEEPIENTLEDTTATSVASKK